MPVIKKQPEIYLSELIENISQISVEEDCEVNAIQIDSRLVSQGDLFIALQGTRSHGLSYLSEIAAAGVNAILFENDEAIEFKEELAGYDDIIKIAVDDVRAVAGKVISKYFGDASKKMNVIGVTGTDGKTSVSRFVAQALSNDSKTAIVGTTGNGLWGELQTATHTTPDVLSLHKLLYGMERESAVNVVMEVSSHGIDQKRIAGIDIDTAVLTNVTRDHLDYHGTIENYRKTKKQLFIHSSIKNVVVNVDDEVGNELANELFKTKTVWAYGLSPIQSDFYNFVYAESIEVLSTGFNVRVVTSQGVVDVEVPLLGRFNVLNALSVISVLLIENVELSEAAKRIKEITAAPGRMEIFVSTNEPMMVVDFAHTPKALEFALKALAEHCEGRIWCVFGCGGDRDKGKRALMGAAAEEIANHIIVTDDNPRSENNGVIIKQILSGINNKDNVTVINDRKQAIVYAYEHAAKNDVVLVAGKGHEEYQLVGDMKIPFNDVAEVKKLLGGNQ